MCKTTDTLPRSIKTERWGYTWETIHDYVYATGKAIDFTAQTVVFYGGRPVWLVTAPGLEPFRTIDLDDAKKILRARYSIASTYGCTGYRTTKPIFPTNAEGR